MTVEETLTAHGIKLESTAPGQHYATCPQCSAKRQPKNHNVKCLGVKIEGSERVCWHCCHCEWSGPEKSCDERQPLITYIYRDADGAPRFRKVRNLPGKEPRFWLERPDANAGWIKGTKDIETSILYRRDEVDKAIKAGQLIALVEGEKDVNNLWAIGIAATCNAHGAPDPTKNQKPKWKAVHSEQLRGADIVVFNDNDVAGYEHADTVCRLSLGVAKRVRRLDLKPHWPDIPKGADVSDWLALGHTREELDGLIAQAPVVEAERAPESVQILPPPSAPVLVARHFVKARCLHNGAAGELTLGYWCGSWWLWKTTHWSEAEPRAVRALLYAYTADALYLNEKGLPEPWSPNRYKISDLLEALSAIVILPDDFEQPGWLDGRPSGPVVATSNGLLDIVSRQLHPHSPLYFGQVSVPFPYDPDAPAPTKWLDFLDELWPDEPDAINVLGEWFGYVISGRLDLQKIFVMVGPTRGGRGVIARILTALIGKRNVCGPTLNSFGSEFGLQPLLGKSLAIISDARSGGGKNSTSSVVVERMLSISGEDTLTVARKYKQAFTGKLGTRLHIISNELPRLGDASSAIVGRLVLLLTTRSWLGKEDFELEKNLLTELPGILNWSLDGLRRLTIENENHFTRFEAADEAITQMRDLASPVGAFVREKCMLGADAEVPVDDLYAAYKAWCQVSEYPKSPKAHFGRDLRAACPSVRKTRPRDGSRRHFVYAGIKLVDQEAEAGVEQELPLGKDDNRPVTVTTMTKDGGRGASGHGGHSDRVNVAPTRDSLDKAACERESGTHRSKSDYLPYTGPVVPVPGLGPDPLDDHGVPVAQAQPANGEPGLSRRRVQGLADWYQDQGHRRHNNGTLDTAELDAELRAILREEVAFPEHVEIEFARVMRVVFAV